MRKEYRASKKAIERYRGKITVIQKLLETAEDIVENGTNESDACRKAGIDKESFRRFMSTDFSFEGDICFVDKCEPTEFPTWQDAIFGAIVGNRYKDAYSYDGFTESVEKEISTLSEREQKILYLRYKEGLTLEEVGKEFGVTRERIREIEAKALRRLRHPSHMRNLCYGYKLIEEDREVTYDLEEKRIRFTEELNGKKAELLKIKEQIAAIPKADTANSEYEKLFSEFCIANEVESLEIREPDRLFITLEEVQKPLSVRTYNCLKRAGCNTLNDVYTIALNRKLWKVRNLGCKSMAEILCKLIEYGADKEQLMNIYGYILAPYYSE